MVTTTTETIGNFRKNLLFETEDFTGTSWTNASITETGSSITTAPDGTLTAQHLADSSAGSPANGKQNVANSLLTDATVYTASLYMKADDSTQSALRIGITNASVYTYLVVDWSGGVATINTTDTQTAGSGVHTYYLRPSRNGFYRLEVSITFDNTAGGGGEDIEFQYRPDTAASSQKACWCWGAQVEERTVASSYQKQLTTTDVWTGDYTTITGWESAHTDPITDDKVYVGELLDGAHVYDADAIVIDAADGNTDATRYRKLTYSTAGVRWGQSAGDRYIPHSHSGPRIYIQWLDNTAAQEGIRVVEDYFQMEGIGIICENPRESQGASTVDRPAVLIQGSNFTGLALFCRVSESVDANTSPSNHLHQCYMVNGTGATFEAVDAKFYNCIAMGGRNGHGATQGFFFSSYAEDGGCYNCVAFSMTRGTARGFWANVASVGVGPERINCLSVGCNANNGADFAGLWARYGYNISSDATALSAVTGGSTYTKDAEGNEGTTTSAADDWSYSFLPAESQLFRPYAQDFRPKAQSTAWNSGRDDESTGWSGVTAEDYLANARSSSAWSIGPFEVVGSPPGAPTEIVELIGSATEGRHYVSVADWADATEEVALRDVAEIRIGEIVRDDASSHDLGASGLRVSRTVTDAGFYRELRGSSTWRYNPTEQAGAKIEGQGTADLECLLYVEEDYFRLTGVALEQDYTSTGSRQVARVDGYGVRFDAVSARFGDSTGTDVRCYQLRGSEFLGTNLLALGGTGSIGATLGYDVAESDRVRLYHCIAIGILQGATGTGFKDGTRATRSELSGCIAVLCDTDYNVGTGVVDFSISEDTSLAGLPGCQSSVTYTTIWNDVSAEDFRLMAGSPALNAGKNLGARFSADFAGNRRLAPFDLGIFEGVGSSIPIGQAPVLRADSQFRCKLIEIIRTDGVGFWFTDANQPIVHAGRTYVPQDGANASARREDAGLGESSVEYVGIVSDSAITTADLLAGKFRDAIVIERTVDWRTPWTEPIEQTIRWLGPGKFDGETWRGDALGVSHFLEQPVGQLLSVTCPVEFGSRECGFDISAETYDNIDVDTVGSDAYREFTADSGDLASTADDWFGNGEVLWLTGSNVNTRSKVKSFTNSTRSFVLATPTGYPIQATDTFQVKAGCWKQYVRDCITKHDNGINHRGEPHILGTDDQFDTLKA